MSTQPPSEPGPKGPKGPTGPKGPKGSKGRKGFCSLLSLRQQYPYPFADYRANTMRMFGKRLGCKHAWGSSLRVKEWKKNKKTG